MNKYVNIIKLYEKLKKTISVEISEWYDGRQLKVNELDDLDVIECTGSYGLEVRDGYLKGNKIRGDQTIGQVVRRIKRRLKQA